ncbi:MAG: hypothetical protein CSA33_00150 [Desulfobulbus propionicus]|nr:MAG: hypothetical protein CSA33_00150 [Desulfobulbus propionicus]
MKGAGFNPSLSSAQVVPGSVTFGISFYLGICVAKILPEMVPSEHQLWCTLWRNLRSLKDSNSICFVFFKTR